MSSPIIPWIGGKRRLAKTIIPLFPVHECYCEPFCGAGAIFFLKPPSRSEVINDINSDLVSLYRVIQHHLEEFIRQFKWSLVSREMYKWLQDTPSQVLTDIQRAARFYYLQKMAFGGKVSGQTFGTSTTTPPRLNLLRIEEDLSSAHLRLARTCIEHLDWQQCIIKYDRPNTLFYLDPPYWQTEGYGVPFKIDEYQAIADLMRTIKGKAILSINDHPDIRAIFTGFDSETVELNYTVGGAKNRVSRKELIVKSW